MTHKFRKKTSQTDGQRHKKFLYRHPNVQLYDIFILTANCILYVILVLYYDMNNLSTHTIITNLIKFIRFWLSNVLRISWIGSATPHLMPNSDVPQLVLTQWLENSRKLLYDKTVRSPNAHNIKCIPRSDRLSTINDCSLLAELLNVQTYLHQRVMLGVFRFLPMLTFFTFFMLRLLSICNS